MITSDGHSSNRHFSLGKTPKKKAKEIFRKEGIYALNGVYSEIAYCSRIGQHRILMYWWKVYQTILKLMKPKEKVYFKKENQKLRKKEFRKIIYRDQKRG